MNPLFVLIIFTKKAPILVTIFRFSPEYFRFTLLIAQYDWCLTPNMHFSVIFKHQYAVKVSTQHTLSQP